MSTVAITGATGVVGSPMLRMLLAEGHVVKALVREDRSAVLMSRLGASPIRGDVLSPESLRQLVAGCDLVFNVAGINEMCRRDSSLMVRVNVDGVRNVMDACRSAGVRRLVHTSSAVTIGEEKGEVGHEASRHRGWFLSEYERSKFLGEQVLFSESAGLDVVSVNPSSVQGPGRATGTGRIILGVVKGDVRLLVDSMISLVDVEDCARGHLLAATRGVAGRRYILNGAVLPARHAVALAGEAVGRRLNPRFVPGGLVRALVAIAGPLTRWLGRDLPVCNEMVRVMTFGHRYDGSAATAELGLDYRPVAETIARTISWFQDEGLLD